MSNIRAGVVIDLNGNLPANSRRFGRSIESMAEGGSRKLAIMGRGVASVSNQLDRLGNRAVLGSAGLAYAFNRTFVQTAAQFERMSVQLEQLEGSQEKAKAALDWVSDFAVRTPLELADVMDAYAKLKTFGIDPMNGSLQILVDQNAKMAGSAEDLNGLILAIGKSWTKSRLQGQEIMMLMERGVPVYDLLAEATGLNVQQLQKLGERGKLTRKSIQLLLDTMGKHAAGSADKFASTWTGMISNISDQFTRFQVLTMEAGAFDVLKGEVRGLLDEINRLNETGELAERAAEFSEQLVSGLREAKEFGTGLWQVMRGVAEAASFVADKVGGFENLGKALAAAYLANKVLRVGGGVMGSLGGLGGKGGGSGNALLDAAKGMRPIPVFVVNPGGGKVPGVPNLGGNTKIFSKAKTTAALLGGTPLSRLAMLGPAAMGMAGLGVAGAGAAGYGVGSLLYKAIDSTDFADSLGRSIAKAMSLVSSDARTALDAEARYSKIEIELTGSAARDARVVQRRGNQDVQVSGQVMGGY